MPTKLPDQITNQISVSLPRWALVAAAAQCAKRVEPIFISDWSNSTQSQIDALRKSIALAQQSVAEATSIIASAKSDATSAFDAAKAATAASTQCKSAARSAKSSGAERAAFPAYAAKAAAETLHFVLCAVGLDAMADNAGGAGDESSAKELIAEAFKAELGAKKCAINAFAAAIDADNSIQDALTSDLESLADAARQNSWSSETAIPADFFARPSPPTQDFLRIKCPKCGKAFRVSVQMRGKKGRCANCKTVFQIAPVRSAPAPLPQTPAPRLSDLHPEFEQQLAALPARKPSELAIAKNDAASMMDYIQKNLASAVEHASKQQMADARKDINHLLEWLDCIVDDTYSKPRFVQTLQTLLIEVKKPLTSDVPDAKQLSAIVSQLHARIMKAKQSLLKQ